MKVQNFYQVILIILTFWVGIALNILPLPTMIECFRPGWVLLILIYWLKMLPRSIGLLVAWGLGFWVDSIQGVVIGQYPLIFSIIALLIMMTRSQSLYFTPLQQLCWISVLIFVGQLIALFIEKWVIGMVSPWWYLTSGIASIMTWPIINPLLKRCYKLGWGPRLG